ncbi:PTS sugar transporter subunit IIA [Lactobacillus kefiranofaciens subsp. kefirgranum]|uniref:PTS sugar transporter subunit IIA n=1 Tax=Lactobacillus kefiranofaciens TaxID=267818 RepID=UPI00202DF72A|nr:PTS sugar transporter subunit IIA [Lactobacillus kefiranofaciens]URW70702.1 PTS sugar transporter subunit IIA [Lactobacillus kefiranofaciens subsp. kefirgranum]URW72646.1 PTS sugar transporter subunit IIA [Lactobacillus kefiranofaciens subsp. kefirgranum]
MTKFKLIVTGHGHFATGLKSAVNLLAGAQENINYIDFTEGMTDKTLHLKLENCIDDNTSTLFFTDLVGGTPYKEAAKIAFNNSKIHVVAGCNLASILETIYKKYDNLTEYANDLVKVSKMGTQNLDLSDISDTSENQNDLDDGI